MKHICILAFLFPFLTLAKIIYPTAGTAWYPGDEVTVKWTRDNTLGLSVVILLSSSENPFPGGGLTHHWTYIAFDSVENRLGEYEWTVPDDITEDRTYRVLIFGNIPNQNMVSDVFHVRFGRKRTVDPVLTIQKDGDVTLKWSGTYGHTYEVEQSPDLLVWSTRETVHATDEELGITVPVTSASRYFRLRDLTIE